MLSDTALGMDMPHIHLEQMDCEHAPYVRAWIRFTDYSGRTVTIPLIRLLEARYGQEDYFLCSIFSSLLIHIHKECVTLFGRAFFLNANELKAKLKSEVGSCPPGQVIAFCKKRIRSNLRRISHMVMRYPKHECVTSWLETSWIYFFGNSSPIPEYEKALAFFLPRGQPQSEIQPHARGCHQEDCSNKIDESSGHMRTFRGTRSTSSRSDPISFSTLSSGKQISSTVSEKSVANQPLYQEHHSFAAPTKSSDSVCDLRYVDSGQRSFYDQVSHRCVTRMPNQNDDGTFKNQSLADQTSTTTNSNLEVEKTDLVGNPV